jgi:mannose/fructose/N-acetylgalactosamine-specific phosphotransferase system component IIC
VNALASGAAGAAIIAFLELDAASVGTFALSRPVFIGPIIGSLAGAPLIGAGLGVAFEALSLEDLPLGGGFVFSAPVAAGVAAYLAAGRANLPLEAAFAAGLAAGWAHARVERGLRRRRCAQARRAEARIAGGQPSRVGSELFSALALQAAGTFAVAFAFFAAAVPASSRAWPALPVVLRGGARAAFLAAPWIGAGSLAGSLWRRA